MNDNADVVNDNAAQFTERAIQSRRPADADEIWRKIEEFERNNQEQKENDERIHP